MDRTSETSQDYAAWKREHSESARRQAELTTLGRVKGGHATGRLPLGYSYRLEDGEAVAHVDESRGPLIEKVWKLAVRRDMSVRRLLPAVREIGLAGEGGRPLSRATLHRMLTNPFYAGWISYRGALYRGNHRPLVDKATFNRVQENLHRRSPASPLRRNTK